MSSDPAFLFYPNDYLGGTTGMTFEEKGAYIDLLIMQFNKGAFSVSQAKKLLNGSFEHLWEVLKEKFKEIDGKFFNERLEKEKSKRQNFIQSQSKKGKESAKKRWIKEDEESNRGYNPPINNKENENENRNINEIKEDRGVGKGEENLWLDSKNSFLNSTDGWVYQFCTEKKIEEHVLKKSMKEFITDIELQEDFKDLRGLRSHFTNWFNKKIKNGTKSNSKQGGYKGKSAGAYELLDELRANFPTE